MAHRVDIQNHELRSQALFTAVARPSLAQAQMNA